MGKQPNVKSIENRRARHKYEILSTLEAGIVLSGCEVKSLRLGNCSLQEAYAAPDKNGEIWLYDMYIAPYKQGGANNPKDPSRPRKLLVHKREAARLAAAVAEKGRTLVPLKLYFNHRGIAKLLLGVAKGKKIYDRRKEIIARDQERHLRRLRSHRR